MAESAAFVKKTAPSIKAMKGKELVVCVTAYDYPFAKLLDASGVDLILVGDSLGNTVVGYRNTLPVTLDEMVHHTKAVARGVERAFLVADLPFGSYGSSVSQAVDSAVALVKAGAEAVKLEGDYPDEVAAIVKLGIPVMGHLGMTPQSVNRFGGFKVQAKGKDGQDALFRTLCSLEEAGAFSCVLELVSPVAAKAATESIGIPTIGIGSGPNCDGQIQVMHDLLGIGAEDFKHAKRYLDGGQLVKDAIGRYASDVKSGQFP